MDHRRQQRLPTWISLNDNLSVKASVSSPASPKALPQSPRRVGSYPLVSSSNNNTTQLHLHHHQRRLNSPKNNRKSGDTNDVQHHERRQYDVHEEPLLRLIEQQSSEDVRLKDDDDTITVLPSPNKATSYGLGLLRAGSSDWKNIRENILATPRDQLIPRLLPRQQQAVANSNKLLLYDQTVLGSACRLNMSSFGSGCHDNDSDMSIDTDVHSTIIAETIHIILDICPEQVSCSQLKVGHTPLRDAVCNPTMLPLVIEMICETIRHCDSMHVLNAVDMNGLTPIDHLVNFIQMDNDFIGAEAALQSLRILLKYVVVNPPFPKLSLRVRGNTDYDIAPESSSPLIRLLSLGTSFGSNNGRTLREAMSSGSPTNKSRMRGSNNSSTSNFSGLLDDKIPDDLPEYEQKKTRLDSNIEEIIGSENRLKRILTCTQDLLGWDISLLYRTSCKTDCTPLHIAIRNYGNYTPLIRELIQRDTTFSKDHPSLLQHRNCFGDLPLHVACSVGVPMNLLKHILEQTSKIQLRHLREIHQEINIVGRKINDYVPNPLVWSINHSGYTPVDLEWIRHIEVGSGFHSSRSFYPLDSRGIQLRRRHGLISSSNNGRYYDEMYDKLLRQAVDQEMISTAHQQNIGSAQPLHSSPCESAIRFDQVNVTSISQGFHKDIKSSMMSDNNNPVDNDGDSMVGLLLNRIFLIIQGAFSCLYDWSESSWSHDIFHKNDVLSHSHNSADYILHQASALSNPFNGPALPRPLLELILWKYQEQVKQQEPLNGKLPLHLALGCWRASSERIITNQTEHEHHSVTPRLQAHVSDRAGDEWKHWIEKLICTFPQGCAMIDAFGRLPIHYALECLSDYSTLAVDSSGNYSNNKSIEEDPPMNEIVKKISILFPPCLEIMDPISKLLPFQLAAANPCISLDTVYYFLRGSPSGIIIISS